MADVKLTKNELRAQQLRLAQLVRYLPTLQLKKAMLQLEIQSARQQLQELIQKIQHHRAAITEYAGLFSLPLHLSIGETAQPEKLISHTENIAGIDIPVFDELLFSPLEYSLFDTPPWVDFVIAELRHLVTLKAKREIAEELIHRLEKELRDVSIRVNLFEKILIPRAYGNIRKIKVFLGDQQLAAVAQAKVAKEKGSRSRAATHKDSEEVVSCG